MPGRELAGNQIRYFKPTVPARPQHLNMIWIQEYHWDWKQKIERLGLYRGRRRRR